MTFADINNPAPLGWTCTTNTWDRELQLVQIITAAFETIEADEEARLRVLRYAVDRFTTDYRISYVGLPGSEGRA